MLIIGNFGGCRMGRRIFRAKGFVQLAGDPARRYLLQQVGRCWTLEEAGGWDGTPPRTEIVCIGPPGQTA